MKVYLCLIFLLSHSPTQSFEKSIILNTVEIVHKKDIKDYCLDISFKLDRLGYLSVSPQQFAKFLWIVSYCESGHQLTASDGVSIGLFQMTADTKRRLGLPKSNSLESQAEGYFRYLKALGKNRVRSIKNSVDLHCYNLTVRDKDGVLSKVTNSKLDALDLNKDSVITKEDLKLFQNKRLNGK